MTMYFSESIEVTNFGNELLKIKMEKNYEKSIVNKSSKFNTYSNPHCSRTYSMHIQGPKDRVCKLFEDTKARIHTLHNELKRGKQSILCRTVLCLPQRLK